MKTLQQAHRLALLLIQDGSSLETAVDTAVSQFGLSNDERELLLHSQCLNEVHGERPLVQS